MCDHAGPRGQNASMDRQECGRDRREPRGRTEDCRSRYPQWRAGSCGGATGGSAPAIGQEVCGTEVLSLDATDEAAPSKVFEVLRMGLLVSRLLRGQGYAARRVVFVLG